MANAKRSEKELDAMIEEATVDCYNDEEELTGFFRCLRTILKFPSRRIYWMCRSRSLPSS